ncbi:MAG: Clp protease N-terminal domain-containing protein, partial [Nannocystaceae bacterium]
MAVFNPEKITVKTRHAIAHAQAMAGELNHPEVTSLHLLSAAIEQDGGLAGPLLERAGVHTSAARRALTAEFGRQPRVSGDVEATPSRELRALLDLAAGEAEALRDKYMSTEHILLACVHDQAVSKKIRAAQLLRELGVNRELLLSALKDLRGTQTVDTEHPEGKYEVLSRYCRDLTEAAAAPKHDPVIGRDVEIR